MQGAARLSVGRELVQVVENQSDWRNIQVPKRLKHEPMVMAWRDATPISELSYGHFGIFLCYFLFSWKPEGDRVRLTMPMLYWIGQNVLGWKCFSGGHSGARLILSETAGDNLFTMSTGTPIGIEPHLAARQGKGKLPLTQSRCGSMLILSLSRAFVILLGIVAGAAIAVADTVNLENACINGLQVDIRGGVVPVASVTRITWTWGDGTSTTGFFPLKVIAVLLTGAASCQRDRSL